MSGVDGWASLFYREIHEGITLSDGEFVAECVVCGELTPIYCSPYIADDEFDPFMHYCGGSPRCCP